MIFSGEQIVAALLELSVTHVVWIPDSDLGTWEAALEASPIHLVRVCREGEAWPLAAGLLLGGQRPLVVMQITGFFESGDALRNVVHDMQLPLFAIIGARNWLKATSTDSAKAFARPVIDAWQVDYVTLESASERNLLAQHYAYCQQLGRAGAVLLAE